MSDQNPDGLPPEDSPLPEDFMDPLADPDEALERLTAERDELRDRFMRALADAENARKRADMERRDA